jgi:hypothetical protein
MEQLDVVKLEVVVKRKKVEDKYKILQPLIDNEMKNIIFTWYSDNEEVLFTNDIFHKQKR